MAILDKHVSNIINLSEYRLKRDTRNSHQLTRGIGFFNLMNQIYGNPIKYSIEKASTIYITDAPNALANQMIEDVMRDFNTPDHESKDYIKSLKQGILLYAGFINRSHFTLQEASIMVRICCMAIEYKRMMNVKNHFNLNHHDLVLANERYNLLYTQQD